MQARLVLWRLVREIGWLLTRAQVTNFASKTIRLQLRYPKKHAYRLTIQLWIMQALFPLIKEHFCNSTLNIHINTHLIYIIVWLKINLYTLNEYT